MRKLIEAKIAELEAYRVGVMAAYDEMAQPHAPQRTDHENWMGVLQSLNGVNDQLSFLRRRLQELS